MNDDSDVSTVNLIVGVVAERQDSARCSSVSRTSLASVDWTDFHTFCRQLVELCLATQQL